MTESISRSMMDMAHTPVPRKKISIFGNYWFIGGAMVGVAITSVLLTLAVLQQSDTYTTGQDMVIPSVENMKVQEHAARPDNVLLDSPIDVEKQRKEQSPTKPRFSFYDSLPKMEVVTLKEEIRMPMKQTQATATEQPANLATVSLTETYYLQAGAFRDKELADKFKLKLAWLGYEGNIQEVSSNDVDIYHRVRIGPFSGLEMLDKTKQRLSEVGVETSTVKDMK